MYEFKEGQFLETEESGKPLIGVGEIRSGLLEMSNAYYQMAKVQMDVSNKLISSQKELLQEALRLVGN